VAAWLDALPAAVVAEDPRLCVARVWLALDQGRLDEADHWLAEAERCLSEGRPGSREGGLPSGIALLRALHRYKTGDVGQAAVAARRAVELEREGTPFWRTVASCVVGVALYWRGATGEAEAALAMALELAEGDDNRLATTYALGYLAALAAGREDAEATDRLLERARAVSEDEPGVGEHFVAMMVELVRAGRLHRQGRPDEAAASTASSPPPPAAKPSPPPAPPACCKGGCGQPAAPHSGVGYSPPPGGRAPGGRVTRASGVSRGGGCA
jgi:LuxR family transcriptional regulator, maltose regulon positive regulatory protein